MFLEAKITLAEAIQTTGLFLGGIFALYQYYKTNKFARLTYLNDVWRKFYENQSFIDTFGHLDHLDTVNNEEAKQQVAQIDLKDKLQFLAFLAEVQLLSQFSESDKRHLMELFQWHFYYCFKNPKTFPAFWTDLVDPNSEDQILKEMKKDYWSKMYVFATECEAYMTQKGSL